MSPEATSPYSDRPIRPLPKRRLRERLSPDVVELIKYPLAPRAKPPLFYHSYNIRDDVILNGSVESYNSAERKRIDDLEKDHNLRRSCDELASEEDDTAYRSWIFSRQSTNTATKTFKYSQKLDTKSYNPQPPGSTASSADGYDSFENTNNKKKRKIPIPGESNLNGARLSGEVVGNNSQDDFLEDLVQHSPSSLQGISGPGRGRYGRSRNGRSPLRTLSDTSNNWSNVRTFKQRQPHWSTSPREAAGIISRSIANANAEKNSLPPSREQENMSLHQQASKKSSPASTQFTFSCDTQVPGWPGPSSSLTLHQSPISTRMSTHATQTSPNLPSNRSAAYTKEMQLSQQYGSNRLKQTQDQTVSLKKTRRRPGKDYLLAARQRRNQQGYRNYHSNTGTEDVWICEFCEYERIFGTPPEALIRQYEIKDRRARKQEAERRRLLEKAKMKGRKGRKGNKSAAKPTLSHDRPSHTQSQNTSNTPADKYQFQSQSIGNPSDDNLKDEYDDDVQFAQDPPPHCHAPSPNVSKTGNVSDIGILTGPRVDTSNERFVAV